MGNRWRTVAAAAAVGAAVGLAVRWRDTLSPTGVETEGMPIAAVPEVVPPSSPVPPGRRRMVEPLDEEKLVQRSSEISSTGYMTIISILQGVAAAILADRTYQAVKPHAASELLIWSQASAVLLILIMIFYFYATLSVFGRGVPSFTDALLPFCVGAVEVPPAYLVGSTDAWPLAMGLLCVVGVAGLGNTALATPEGLFANKFARAEFIGMLKGVAAVLGLLGILMAGCAGLQKGYPAEQAVWGVLAPSSVIAAMLAAALLMERKLCTIYAFYGVVRPFFQ